MKRLFMVAVASLFTLLASLQLQASLVPPLKLKTLTSKADVIVVGRVSGIAVRGPTMVHPQFIGGSVPGHEFMGSLEVQTILKGDVPTGPLDFSFALPDAPAGYAGIGPGDFGVFFLERGARGLEIADPYYPFLVAAPGISKVPGALIDQVVAEVRHVFSYPDSSQSTQIRALLVLEAVNTPAARAALMEAANSPHVSVRVPVLDTLLSRGDLSVLPAITSAAFSSASSDDDLMTGIGGTLRGVSDPRAIPALKTLLRAPNVWVRRGAAAALRNTHSQKAIIPLSGALSDSDREVRYYAVVGLGEITGQNEWTPSIANFDQDEKRYLKHWQSWAKQLKPPGSSPSTNSTQPVTEPNNKP